MRAKIKVGDYIRKRKHFWYSERRKKYSIPCRGKVVKLKGGGEVIIQTPFGGRRASVSLEGWKRFRPRRGIFWKLLRLLFRPIKKLFRAIKELIRVKR